MGYLYDQDNAIDGVLKNQETKELLDLVENLQLLSLYSGITKVRVWNESTQQYHEAKLRMSGDSIIIDCK